jgi:predicted nucleic acid-binding protein
LIVVDTSVWIQASHQPQMRAVLNELIDADEVTLALPVRLELLSGVPRRSRAAFYLTFSALPQLLPSADTWQPLHEWIERAADAGERFSIPDLLIAALAAEIGGLVWSLDKDFERMEQLGLVSLYAPPSIS